MEIAGLGQLIEGVLSSEKTVVIGKISKNFVFNLISEDLSKFSLGEDLFNLITTALIFDQSVIVILKSSQDILKDKNLLYLSNLFGAPQGLRLIVDNERPIENINLDMPIEFLKSNEINDVIEEADYFVNC